MSQQPLAYLLRPTSIKDVIGQKHLLNNKDALLSKILERKFVTSLLFYGNPGIGKTSIALALASDLHVNFSVYNAAIDKKETLVEAIGDARTHQPYVIIVEEIHRMNKNIQDVLLDGLERGDYYIFACTTENPFFTVNPAIRSRLSIVQLEPITESELVEGLHRIIDYRLKKSMRFEEDAIKMIARLVGGDLRSAINILELLYNLYDNEVITTKIIKRVAPSARLLNDNDGDEHHDLKSAFQKSIRGSDVDASLHYLVRLLAAGDYEALLRRMVIIGYEDVGMANPALCARVKTACDAFREIGMPEGILPLGLAVVEMALSEKSNSVDLASRAAYTDLMSGAIYPIPLHLRDTHYQSAKKLGSGIGYKFPHDFPNDWVEQTYLPKNLSTAHYYTPKMHSVYESKIYEIYCRFAKK